jgi:hypothetical protein
MPSNTKQVDPKLLEFCTTEWQKIQINELIKCDGSSEEAAKNLNIDAGSLRKVRRLIEKRAAAKGYDPERDLTKTVGDSQLLAGASTLYGEDGQIKLQWVKSMPEKEAAIRDKLKDYAEALTAEMAQYIPQEPQPKLCNDPDLLSAIFMGDAHVGQYSHAPETRQDNFDTSMATSQIRAAVDYLVEKAPPAETGMFVDVGDALHADSAHNATFAGTPLDVDTRYHNTFYKLAEVMKYTVIRMLEKFPKVVVIVARGNHNDSSAIAIQVLLSFYFEHEPRVTILPTQGYFHYVQFGKWLIAVHHGDKVKSNDLPGILARDLPKAWGETTHRMWALGHIHHQTTKEMAGCIIRTFGTLAPPDGWHASKGYGSERVMEMLTFKREGGLHSTYQYSIPRGIVEPDVKL